MSKWQFIPDEYEWKVYKDGELYCTFGLGQTEFKGTDLFVIIDPHDPQELLDLVLELIFQMEEETGEPFPDTDDGIDDKWCLEEEMFCVLAREFGGVR